MTDNQSTWSYRGQERAVRGTVPDFGAVLDAMIEGEGELLSQVSPPSSPSYSALSFHAPVRHSLEAVHADDVSGMRHLVDESQPRRPPLPLATSTAVRRETGRRVVTAEEYDAAASEIPSSDTSLRAASAIVRRTHAMRGIQAQLNADTAHHVARMEAMETEMQRLRAQVAHMSEAKRKTDAEQRGLDRNVRPHIEPDNLSQQLNDDDFADVASIRTDDWVNGQRHAWSVTGEDVQRMMADNSRSMMRDVRNIVADAIRSLSGSQGAVANAPAEATAGPAVRVSGIVSGVTRSIIVTTTSVSAVTTVAARPATLASPALISYTVPTPVIAISNVPTPTVMIPTIPQKKRNLPEVPVSGAQGLDSLPVSKEPVIIATASNANVGGNVKEEPEEKEVQKSARASAESVIVAERSQRCDIKLPKYSGDADVEYYLTQFRYIAEANGWPEQRWGTYLAGHLQGGARRVLSTDSSTPTPDFKTLSSKLRARFGSEANTAWYQQQLNCRKRRDKEGINELMQNVLDLAARGIPRADDALLSDIAKISFINALTDEDQRLFVSAACPQTIQEAAQKALAYENAKRSEEKFHREPKKGVRAVTIPEDDRQTDGVTTSPGRKSKGQKGKKGKQQRGVQSAFTPAVAAMTSTPTTQVTSEEEIAKVVSNLLGPQISQLQSQMAALSLSQATGYTNRPKGNGTSSCRSQGYGSKPSGPSDQFRCFNCGSSDHWKRECPLPPRPREPGNGEGRGSNGQSNGQRPASQ
jgi:Zinc knuckle